MAGRYMAGQEMARVRTECDSTKEARYGSRSIQWRFLVVAIPRRTKEEERTVFYLPMTGCAEHSACMQIKRELGLKVFSLQSRKNEARPH